MDIGRKLAESVGLFMDLFKDWPCQFRINKYNFTPESVGSSGVQIHTDSGFLTILQDDEHVGGLEVMDQKSGEYVAVDPWPGTLLVNLGDFAAVCETYTTACAFFFFSLNLSFYLSGYIMHQLFDVGGKRYGAMGGSAM